MRIKWLIGIVVMTIAGLWFMASGLRVETAVADTENLITNGGFESGLTGWNYSTNVTIVNGNGGGNAVNIPTNHWISQTFTVDTPGIYLFSYDATGTHHVYWTRARLHIIPHELNTPFHFIGTTGNVINSSWRSIDNYIMLTPGVYDLFIINTPVNQNRAVRLDNISLSYKSDNVNYHGGLIENGGVSGWSGWNWSDSARYRPDIGPYTTTHGAVELTRHATSFITQTIDIIASDTYTLTLTCFHANSSYSGSVRVIIGSHNQTSGCQSQQWTPITQTIYLEPGQYELKIAGNSAHSNESNRFVDLIRLMPPGWTPPDDPTDPPDDDPLLDRMIWSAWPECPVCTAQNAVGWVGGPINTRNGNLSYQETDLALPVRGGSLSFRRAYASQAVNVYTTTLGHGWSHNYEMRLHWNNNALTETVELQAPGGSRLPFFDNGDGSYTPYAGVTAELTYNSLNDEYVVTGFNQTTYLFDGLGQLVEQIDPFGNSIHFSYDNGRLGPGRAGQPLFDV
jgi:hypothetical protein